MRRDRKDKRTHSQNEASNLGAKTATVNDGLEGKGREVFSVAPEDTIGTAVEVLRDKRIGAVVVTDETGALCGILSERDIVRKLADTPGRTLPQLVSGVMTPKVQACDPDEALVSVLKRMTAGRFRHMPVVENEKLIGMITIGDVVNFRLEELEHEALQMKQLIVG